MFLRKKSIRFYSLILFGVGERVRTSAPIARPSSLANCCVNFSIRSPPTLSKYTVLKIQFKSIYLLFYVLFLCYFIHFLVPYLCSYIYVFVPLLFCNYMYLYVVVIYFIPAYCSIIFITLLLALITFSLLKCKYHPTVTPYIFMSKYFSHFFYWHSSHHS